MEQSKLFEDNVVELEQEVAVVADREYQRTQNEGESCYISKIKNKHEGYGHAAEKIVMTKMAMKRAQSDVDEFLLKLSEQSDIVVRDTAGALYGHAIAIAKEAITMAAVAKRIVYDILTDQNNDIPMEELFDADAEETETETEQKDRNPEDNVILFEDAINK